MLVVFEYAFSAWYMYMYDTMCRSRFGLPKLCRCSPWLSLVPTEYQRLSSDTQIPASLPS